MIFCLWFVVVEVATSLFESGSNLGNFNYKPQVESHQQHLALYRDRLLPMIPIMIEVANRHMECTHFVTVGCLPLRYIAKTQMFKFFRKFLLKMKAFLS